MANNISEIKMNWAELFTMMYYVFDAIYDNLPDEKKTNIDNQQDNLQDYIDEIDPINNVWSDFSSSDPAYFEEFCKFMEDKSIGDDYGYSLICDYLKTEDYYHNVLEYFESYGKEDFITATKDFLTNNERLGKDWIPPQNKSETGV